MRSAIFAVSGEKSSLHFALASDFRNHMHEERKDQRDHGASVRPKQRFVALFLLEHDDAEDDGDHRQRSRDETRDRNPRKENLNHDMRHHQRSGAEAEEAMVFDEEFHDAHVELLEFVLLGQLHDPLAVDKLDHEIHDRGAECNSGENAEKFA